MKAYRLIPLLNVDTSILMKILAHHLSKILDDFRHVDQTGLMPMKGT